MPEIVDRCLCDRRRKAKRRERKRVFAPIEETSDQSRSVAAEVRRLQLEALKRERGPPGRHYSPQEMTRDVFNLALESREHDIGPMQLEHCRVHDVGPSVRVAGFETGTFGSLPFTLASSSFTRSTVR